MSQEEVVPSSFFKPAVITTACCLVMGALALSSERIPSTYSASTLLRSRPLFEASINKGPSPRLSTGRQSFPGKGCATLYGSNPDKFPQTTASTICSDKELLMYSVLEDKSLGVGALNHGVSYVETGEYTYVTLYSKDNFEGEAYTISPTSSLDLMTVPTERESSATSWNDHSRSIGIVSQGETAVFLVEGEQNPNDSCVVLFASDPESFKNTVGVTMCGEAQKDYYSFSYEDFLAERIRLEDHSKGVSHIKTGPKVKKVTCWTKRDFEGDSISFFGEGSFELSRERIPNSPRYFGDNVFSFEVWLK